MNKQTILDALYTFANKRPQLEYGNYGDPVAYRAESRAITRDLHDARRLLRAVELRSSITAQEILDASRRAFSGRLTITAEADSVQIDYCIGQYFPTEYRRAVAAILSSALWDYWRSDATDAQRIRNTARREFGKGIAQRYFN